MPRLRRNRREAYEEPTRQDVTLGVLLAETSGEHLTEAGYLARHRASWDAAQKRTPAQKARDEAALAALLEAAAARAAEEEARLRAGEEVGA